MVPHEHLYDHHHHHHGFKHFLSKLKNAIRERRLFRHCKDASCQKRGKCSCPPPDVPHGFLAVYAGRERKRFVIPAIYLNHPAFRLLLEKAKEEYGFSQKGGLNIPLEVFLFERLLWLVGHGDPIPDELGVDELEQYYRDKYHLSMEVIDLDD